MHISLLHTNARYRISATSPTGKTLEAFAATWELALKVYETLSAQAATDIEIGLSSAREAPERQLPAPTRLTAGVSRYGSRRHRRIQALEY